MVFQLLQFNTYYSILKGSPFILKVGNILTEFALQKLVINTIKSMSWKGSTDGKSILKVENPSIQYLVHQEEGKFLCSCGFSRAFKLPCEHVLSFLSEKKQEDQILGYIDIRWRNSIQIPKEDSVSNELKKIIEEKGKIEEMNDQDVQHVENSL